jgi:hypothetical protein
VPLRRLGQRRLPNLPAPRCSRQHGLGRSCVGTGAPGFMLGPSFVLPRRRPIALLAV